MKYYLLLIFVLAIAHSRIVMNKDEWVQKLESLAQRSTIYKNVWPYNVLYCDGSNWYCDCVNLLKALFNGRNIDDWTAGSYQRNLDNTGDVTCHQFINKCTDVSSNFKKLKDGEPRVLYMEDHIGSYIGKTIDGLYNVIECTGAWGGGIKYSWVDSDGTRRNHKGGSSKGTWLKNGLPTKWVSY